MASINSNSTSAVKAGVIKAEYSLVFITPELLLASKWREILHSTNYTRRVKAFVVDEAHTVKKWYIQLISQTCNRLQSRGEPHYIMEVLSLCFSCSGHL